MPLSAQDLSELTGWRRELHRWPELSGQEVETARRVEAALAASGPDRIVTKLGGHGVAALYDGRAPGPTVMLRAELDGLPIDEIGDVLECAQSELVGALVLPKSRTADFGIAVADNNAQGTNHLAAWVLVALRSLSFCLAFHVPSFTFSSSVSAIRSAVRPPRAISSSRPRKASSPAATSERMRSKATRVSAFKRRAASGAATGCTLRRQRRGRFAARRWPAPSKAEGG